MVVGGGDDTSPASPEVLTNLIPFFLPLVCKVATHKKCEGKVSTYYGKGVQVPCSSQTSSSTHSCLGTPGVGEGAALGPLRTTLPHPLEGWPRRVDSKTVDSKTAFVLVLCPG